MDSATTIKIDLRLENVREARAFENSEEIIQQKVMHEFFDLVYQSLAIAESKKSKGNNYSADFERTRYHNTITISGGRGSDRNLLLRVRTADR